jgi:hypothetical protein
MFDKIDDFVSDLKSEIANLERENYKLKRKLEELQDEKDKVENKKWIPKEGEKYYFATHFGVVGVAIYEGASGDEWCIEQGNYFRSENEAELYLENLKTKAELKVLADELNGGNVIDWNDFHQEKYYLICDVYNNRIDDSSCETCMISGNVYCLDANFLKTAIECIGEKRLIDMIKAGV